MRRRAQAGRGDGPQSRRGAACRRRATPTPDGGLVDVQRWPMFSPARFTIAPTSCRARSSTVRAAMSHWASPAPWERVGRRGRRRGRRPRAPRQSADPIRPEEPVTATRMAQFYTKPGQVVAVRPPAWEDRAMDVEAIVARIWPGTHVDIQVLGGGITNHNFKVDAPGGPYVLRIAGQDTDAARHRPRPSSTRRRTRPPPSGSGPRSSSSSSRRDTSSRATSRARSCPLERMREPE